MGAAFLILFGLPYITLLPLIIRNNAENDIIKKVSLYYRLNGSFCSTREIFFRAYMRVQIRDDVKTISFYDSS